MYSPEFHSTCIGMETTPGNPCRCCCEMCINMLCGSHIADHSQCPQPKRYWWYKKDEWDWMPYQFFYLGGDEWCNRTIVLRLWRPLVIALNIPLRRESCEECRHLN